MNMKQSLLTATLAVTLAACGGGGGGGGGGGTKTTPITSSAQGTSVAATSVQASTVGASSVNLSSLVGGAMGAPAYRSPLAGKDPLMNRFTAAMARVVQASRFNAAAVKSTVVNETSPCTTSGSMTLAGTVDDVTGAFDLTITFAACREGSSLMNGDISLAGGNSFIVTMGGGDGVLNNGDDLVSQTLDAGGVAIDTFRMDLTMAMTQSSTSTTTIMGMTYNGKGELTDAAGTATFSYVNFKANSTMAKDGTWGRDVLNGTIDLGWNDTVTDQSITLSYTNFAMGWDLTDPAVMLNTIDGTIRLNFDPDVLCNGASADGTFTFDTVTPIAYNTSTWTTTAGEMTINRNTTVVYNADGSVDVTVTGQPAQHFNTVGDLEAMCEIPEMQAM